MPSHLYILLIPYEKAKTSYLQELQLIIKYAENGSSIAIIFSQ
ncbi:hypothetical protein XM38_014350 [Halomicronema hongdechloris C2206]|uniref:Uncharacterized protein n=1 Tax=Halomicronema hongdechloris C2206 TaxID=1641165 RepID=A0A1Z3HJQ6_9CYAN|nr:hypothetical protein XM38_014350 [Halomicronema hongdechloris C2206]